MRRPANLRIISRRNQDHLPPHPPNHHRIIPDRTKGIPFIKGYEDALASKVATGYAELLLLRIHLWRGHGNFSH